MRSTQVTPGGIRVCGHTPLTTDELDAVDELAEFMVQQEERRRAQEERRRAALSPDERADEDARRAVGRERLARLQGRAREAGGA